MVCCCWRTVCEYYGFSVGHQPSWSIRSQCDYMEVFLEELPKGPYLKTSNPSRTLLCLVAFVAKGFRQSCLPWVIRVQKSLPEFLFSKSVPERFCFQMRGVVTGDVGAPWVVRLQDGFCSLYVRPRELANLVGAMAWPRAYRWTQGCQAMRQSHGPTLACARCPEKVVLILTLIVGKIKKAQCPKSGGEIVRYPKLDVLKNHNLGPIYTATLRSWADFSNRCLNKG